MKLLIWEEYYVLYLAQAFLHHLHIASLII